MKQVRESFSALMDNEADEFDLRRVLKSLGSASEESDTWRRYHLARSMMQRERDAVVNIDISGDVLAALADEPQPLSAPGHESTKRHSFSFMGGAAVAAAVSLMVIAGAQVYNGRFAGDTESSPDVASGTVLPPSSGTQPSFASETSSGGNGVMPASMQAPASDGLPYFSANGAGSGLMTIGENVMSPMFLSSGSEQPSIDREQAETLQSYLERHSLGAAYSTGDSWMPLLRAPGTYASQLNSIGATETR